MRPSLRGGRRDVLAGLACVIGVGAPTGARATIEPAAFDIRRYVYVPSTTAPDVTVIDTEDDRISGLLHIGIVARQVLVSRDTATLIATDGQSPLVSLVDGRWCTRQTKGEMVPKPNLLCDDRLATDGIRPSGLQHPVQRSHADGSLGLLAGKAAGSQTRSDQRFVATHCRFY